MRLNRLFPASLLVFVSPLVVVACGGSGASVGSSPDAGAATDVAVVDVAASEALGYIPSSKAEEHMGEAGTVRGSVKGYNYISGGKGRPYILLFDKPRIVKSKAALGDLEVPSSFKVVIWKDYHKNFPANFAGAYAGHTVCATGTIVEYNGDPAIEAQDPSQLVIDC